LNNNKQQNINQELPLYDINMERTVISSFIFNPSLVSEYIEKLHPDMFYLPAHSHFITAILLLEAQDKPIDENFIRAELKNNYDEVALLEVISTYPLSSGINDYLKRIEEHFNKRSLSNMTLDIRKGLYNNESSIEIEETILKKLEVVQKRQSDSIVNIVDLTDVTAEDVKFINQEWLPIPEKTVSIFTGKGGLGKSQTILQLLYRYLKNNSEKKAFAWLSEDPLGLTKHRAEKICKLILNDDTNNYKGRLSITDTPSIQIVEMEGSRAKINPEFYILKNKFKDYDLIILDPLIAFFGGDENNNSHARMFMQLFTNWAAKENKIIIFIHHSSKEKITARGASAFVDAARLVYGMDNISEEESNRDSSIDPVTYRKFIVIKENHGIKNILKNSVVFRKIIPENNKIVFETKFRDDATPQDRKEEITKALGDFR
jgi:replicative DNA helicase